MLPIPEVLKRYNMTPTFFPPTALVLLLLLTVLGNTQNNPPVYSLREKDTIGKPDVDTSSKLPTRSNLAVLSRQESLKRKKKTKKIIDTNDTINPYQPNKTVVKPLPYNSHKEKDKPIEKPILPLGDILRDVIVPKKNY